MKDGGSPRGQPEFNREEIMEPSALKLLLVGGPTLLFEWAGLRILTDPTFDPPGSQYPAGPIVLTKTTGPALPVEGVGAIDVVLLSHDQHPDNLDLAGRALLPRAARVLTTASGGARLGGNALGLAPWASISLPARDGSSVTITATPGRHGPPGCEPICGDVTGFVLQCSDRADTIYFAGDTVWYEGVAEVAQRFRVTTAILCLGAARLREVSPEHLTMTAADALATMRAFPQAKVIPVHFDGWAHWTEGRASLANAFAEGGCASRVLWLEPGTWTTA